MLGNGYVWTEIGIEEISEMTEHIPVAPESVREGEMLLKIRTSQRYSAEGHEVVT